MNFCIQCHWLDKSPAPMGYVTYGCLAPDAAIINYVTGERSTPQCSDVRRESSSCPHFKEKS